MARYTGKEFQEAWLENFRKGLSGELPGAMRFGIPCLDDYIGGIRKTELILLVGAQKAGKTTVSVAQFLNLAKQLAEEGEEVAYFSAEMGLVAFGNKLNSAMAGVNVNHLRDYTVDEQELAEIEANLHEMEALNMMIDVGSYVVEDVVSYVNQSKTPIAAVVIDYFQLLRSKRRFDKRHEELSYISHTLKELANTKGLAVILIAHQTREALLNPKLREDPNTIAGSQDSVRDCDLLMIILPVEDEAGYDVPHMRDVHIALSRNSQMGDTFRMYFDAVYNRFGELSDDDYAPEVE